MSENESPPPFIIFDDFVVCRLARILDTREGAASMSHQVATRKYNGVCHGQIFLKYNLYDGVTCLIFFYSFDTHMLLPRSFVFPLLLLLLLQAGIALLSCSLGQGGTRQLWTCEYMRERGL